MCKINLSQFSNVLVQIAKCICLNFQIYLSKLPSVFVQMADFLNERVAEIEHVQVGEVKEQLHQQLGQVEAQLAAQKKVSKG